MTGKPMLDGRELSEDDLDQIRLQLDDFETIEGVRERRNARLIAELWPDQLMKMMPPKKN